MGKVFVFMGITVDGYVAPEVLPDDPEGRRWMADWSKIRAWAFPQRFFREMLKLGEGGETGPIDDFCVETHRRTGASVLGKRMFDGGEPRWPEEAPFHTPVFVVTHQKREPWERPGGTTFHFVNDGIESALRRAREAAGTRDVRIGGGANLVRQYLEAGLVDEISLAVSPVVLGRGIRLFEEPGKQPFDLEILGVVSSPRVSVVRYAVRP